ncbi:MAG: SDR family NAD(P)-dependent oxidoreductase [Proteobacteria bacterium]|nr:MAG: SDR family NAD(P)-dependent oxidoreductase [Pseudomonadota bacterium]
MQLSGNTILITGGGSGIGLGLAEEFKRLGNEVIVAGRTRAKLKDAEAKGLHALTVDMNDEKSIASLAADAIAKFPALNVVIHNAGIMINEKLVKANNAQIAKDTIATNLTGPILLTTAILPHLLKQKSAAIITVTSGLAYVPLVLAPTYSATKGAIHSYTMSLRYQLQGTPVEVKELIPPYVRTALMGERQAADANAMPLDEFIAEVFSILRGQPDAEAIAVKRAHPQVKAAFAGEEKYDEFFRTQSDRLMQARRAEWDAL